jgi:hypothetical protein
MNIDELTAKVQQTLSAIDARDLADDNGWLVSVRHREHR